MNYKPLKKIEKQESKTTVTIKIHVDRYGLMNGRMGEKGGFRLTENTVSTGT